MGALGAAAGSVAVMVWMITHFLGQALSPAPSIVPNWEFSGQLENNVVASPPWYGECNVFIQMGGGILPDHHCTTNQIKGDLTEKQCLILKAYSDSLPGLGYANNAKCTKGV
jgi:hypothetical protein